MATYQLDRRGLVRGLGGAAGLAALAAGGRGSLAQDGSALTIRCPRDMAILDPGYMVGGLAEISAQWACLVQLANYESGSAWGWQPSAVVERLEWIDPQRIGFKLREGFQWSNGYGEVVADDVKFGLERILESEWSGYVIALDHVELTGSHEGEIVLSFPFAPTLLLSLCFTTGSLMSRAALEDVGGRYTSEFPAICGPYQISEWALGQQLVLTPNPLWIGPKPEIEEVRLVTIGDDKAAEIAFETGEIMQTTISADSVPRIRDAMPENSTLLLQPGLTYTWFGMNTQHPKLEDIRIRRAIQQAIDVDSINEAAYNNVPPKSHGIVPPGLIGHRTHSNYAYDPDAARALLHEAGAQGLQIELKTLNTTDRLAASQIVQANLADVGIEVVIVPLDSGPFWNLGLESEGDDWKDLQMWLMRYSSSPDPYEPFQWFVRDQVGVWNWERWSDDEFEDLYQQGLRETDPARREEIYLRMQEIMEETGAYVWLNHEPIPTLYSNVMDPAIHPDGNFFLPWYRWA